MKRLHFESTPYGNLLRTAAMVCLSVGVTTGIYAREPGKRGESHTGLNKVTQVKIRESYGKLPLSFIKNQGQMNEKVRFYERGHGRTLFFTDRGVYLSLVGANPRVCPDGSSTTARNSKSELIRLIPLGARKNPEIHAEGLQDSKVNYFMGNDSQKWKTNIPTYQSVVYKGMYQGIDMKFYGNNRQIEYDIIVNPGANPSRIQLSYDGVEDLRITEKGDLEICLKEGKLLQKRPYIYQEIEGKKVERTGAFKVSRLGSKVQNPKPETRNSKHFTYTFRVASYDKRYPLVIDPILVYSTYLGGSDEDSGVDIAVDTAGNAYITGSTGSTDFPTDNAFDESLTGSRDVFVTKLNAAGNDLIYSTYLGGSGGDSSDFIAVDADGNAYITGGTGSTDFPTANAFDKSPNGNSDAFVTKLNAAGNGLIYSTYLGGSGDDGGNGIAVDTAGSAYITGGTGSTDFPTDNAFDENLTGSRDAFVTKLNAAGTSLVYSTYLGGSGGFFEFEDIGSGIAVDTAGNAYITGSTDSTDFPTANAFDESLNGFTDAFVTKLNAAGTSLIYSTYLGGDDLLRDDLGIGIAVDTIGNAYIAGQTGSTDFPTANAFDESLNGVKDVFVTKLNAAGTGLIYSTYLGGSAGPPRFADETCNGMAVDTDGNVYITGDTDSPDFPTVNALDNKLDGDFDAFVTKLNAAGNGLIYSTYLGGGVDELLTPGYDVGQGIAVDADGNAYITGFTGSPDFPTANAFDESLDGFEDAFVTKIAADVKPPSRKAKWIKASPVQLKIKKGTDGKITVTVTGKERCPVEGKVVKAFIQGGKNQISISSDRQTTDANGQAVFTVHARQIGTAKVIFRTSGVYKRAFVLVHVIKPRSTKRTIKS
ncbi:MAG: Phage tail fiber protein [Candidatus Jettenia ecosi]|uniref:Phage tail fiber protein n=1 Tax=Candidatus Jettenia ecosi TaxID=2494326 RepID=A0A533Q8S8_9BACT|nr:MAG: Phage tail fiber protein [Candidatus Jettenia ecosi]